MQVEITRPGKLLAPSGRLAKVGWSRFPMLECNLEQASFYPGFLQPLQRFRIKRWDYYAVFTPRHFFSATIADLGYAGNVFVYFMDFVTGELHEEGLVIPFGKGLQLPRDSTQGVSCYEGKGAWLSFEVKPGCRQISVSWPGFNQGHGLWADLQLDEPPERESMTVVVPIKGRRFYYNRKINCMLAEGTLKYGNVTEEVKPHESLGSLDWGRGVWPYRSYWNWASASGFLPDGRTLGLNLGGGFGNTSVATENCLILDGRIHKLEQIQFAYDPHHYMKPWKFRDSQGRLELEFVPFKERVARTDLMLIFSEVHQMFGRYSGKVISDSGDVIPIVNLIGFAEEHHARW